MEENNKGKPMHENESETLQKHAYQKKIATERSIYFEISPKHYKMKLK